MGLQPPKPQLAAQSACLEECEGLLMVTPSLTVLGELLSFAFFSSLTLTFFLNTHKHGHKQTCRPTENVDIHAATETLSL